jgi:hypothetical protein
MTFPRLKTGAVAQYPVERRVRFANQVLRFVDGSEQRYPESRPLRQWVILIDMLDDAEVAAIAEFFETNQGGFASFEFTDPWDGTVYPDCSVEGDELEIEQVGEAWARVAVVIRENR